MLLTWHLCWDAGQLLTQNVVVGVEEGQLIHHGLFRNEVENLCDFPILNYWHASDRVLPLDAVHNYVVAGAADPAERTEVEEAWHADVVEAFSPTAQAAGRVQVRNHKDVKALCPDCSLWLSQRTGLCVWVWVCVCLRQAGKGLTLTTGPLRRLSKYIFRVYLHGKQDLAQGCLYQLSFP